MTKDIDFSFCRYLYQSPVDVLKYVMDKAPQGDPAAVLDAIDTFSNAFPM